MGASPLVAFLPFDVFAAETADVVVDQAVPVVAAEPSDGTVVVSAGTAQVEVGATMVEPVVVVGEAEVHDG